MRFLPEGFARRLTPRAVYAALAGDVIVRRFLLLSSGHAVSVLCGFASTVIMVRALGPAGFGLIALALAILNYGIVFSNFGTDLFAIRSTAQDRAKLTENLFFVSATRLLFGVLIGIAIMLSCLAGLWPEGAVLPIAISGLSIFAAAAYPLWAPQAMEKIGVVAFFTIASQLFFLLLVVAVAANDGGVAAFAWAKAASDAVVAALLFAFIMKTEASGRFLRPLRSLPAFWRKAAPLGLSQIMRSLALGSDLVILSFLAPAAALGLYAVALRVFTMSLAVSSMFFVVVLPIFSKHASGSRGALKDALSTMMRRNAPVVAIGVVAAAMAAKPALSFFFGEEFAGAAAALQVLMLAAGANFLNRGYRQVLLALGRNRDDFVSTAAGAACNLTAKVVLIPFLGFMGAAFATLIGEAVLMLAQRMLALRALKGSSTFPAGENK
jgi:O-antigen/teichoic acid export membrane protein